MFCYSDLVGFQVHGGIVRQLIYLIFCILVLGRQKHSQQQSNALCAQFLGQWKNVFVNRSSCQCLPNDNARNGPTRLAYMKMNVDMLFSSRENQTKCHLLIFLHPPEPKCHPHNYLILREIIHLSIMRDCHMSDCPIPVMMPPTPIIIIMQL